uniref:site-specific DNA-methyltransferase (cytosine-N(4)-specific) n=1 Tax=viral metagenome TaxID=1070528 RepID=A0A6M3JN71_9ZZZZ
MAKDLDSLQTSRDLRSEIKAKYGFIPTSIIEAEKQSYQSKDTNAEKRNYYSTTNVKFGDVADTIFDVSGQSCRGKGGALSRYPQNIGRYLVKMYSNEGDTVLDPFAGHNSRMELVYKLGRNYVGYDISHTFMEANRKEAKELQGEGNQAILFKQSTIITLIEKDSRELLESSIDMCLTSPPYYDIEWYGDEPEQLGKCQSYEDFIDDITIVLRRCYEALKPDKFCCWSINDFRRNGKFISYHSDIIQAYLKVGFSLHDIVITDLGYPIGAAFASQLEEQKRTAKRHEYTIIGHK